jgi:hypothetical protein
MIYLLLVTAPWERKDADARTKIHEAHNRRATLHRTWTERRTIDPFDRHIAWQEYEYDIQRDREELRPS